MFKQLHPNVRARIIISFFSKIIGASILPFMAIYFTNMLNSYIAGVLLIINIIVQFIASIYGGYLTDNIGRRKLLVVGEWTKVIALTGMAISNSSIFHSVSITFVMLLIMSIAQGIILPASEAMLIDVSNPETRTYMYSINYWGSNLSMMIGIIIGGWLFQQHFSKLLILVVVISIFTAILTTKIIRETLKINNYIKKESITFKNIFKGYQAVARDSRFMLFILGGIMLMSIEFQRDNYISIRLAQEFPPMNILLKNIPITIDGIRMLSIITVINMLFIVLFTPLVTKKVEKYKEIKMYIGFFLFTVGYTICSFSNNIVILLLATITFSIGELIYVPIRQSILSEIVNENSRGAYMAFNSLVFQIGKLIASSCLLISPYINKYMMGLIVLIFGLSSITSTLLAISKKKYMDMYKIN